MGASLALNVLFCGSLRPNPKVCPVYRLNGGRRGCRPNGQEAENKSLRGLM